MRAEDDLRYDGAPVSLDRHLGVSRVTLGLSSVGPPPALIMMKLLAQRDIGRLRGRRRPCRPAPRSGGARDDQLGRGCTTRPQVF
jgi:hypothetical protein